MKISERIEKNKEVKAMIVAAHPDDAEIGMGGAIVKMIESGWEVIIVDLTDGEPTPLGTKEIRQKETDTASKILGIEKRFCLDMPNRYLTATLEYRRKLAETIRIHQPDILFGPVNEDYHPDHIEAAKLIDGARFEAKFHKTDMKGVPWWVPKLYSYFSIHKMNYDKPSFIIDISDQWERKFKAIQAYQSQTNNNSFKSTNLLERVEVIFRYFGQRIDTKYGEPFISNEPISIKNLSIMNHD
ncbi:MAG: bacillithiol biosynthesis deacetylase BshB1 [Sedimentisphaerales bacterium]|nr:bacillithiol biosynthesis deacetylase BshB1 [Sedimentisphaerales bacterium]